MKENFKDRAARVLSPVLARYHELEVEKGQGVYLIGRDGRKYLDFSTGVAVTGTGHCHPKIVTAAKKQVSKLIHACAGIAYYEANIALAEKLKEITPEGLGLSFFCQSGAEAVEAAIKLAKYVTKRPGLICFKGSFHGRTLGALSITTSKAKYREGYEPLLPNVYVAPYAYCYRCPYNLKPEDCGLRCLSETESLIDSIGAANLAAVIVEPVQGEGGYVIPPKAFISGLKNLCEAHNLLLIFDEVQTGFGRTGKMFAAEYFEVTPDIMALAKAIASGFPLGAVIAKESLMRAWLPGAHGSTLGGNPVSCAAGLATIEVMQKEKLVEKSEKLGAYLKGKLEKLKSKHPVIGDVRGIGLMIGVEFIKPQNKEPDPDFVKRILAFCLKEGLILISCGNSDQVIRFIPPLIIKKPEIDKALKIFEKALENA